MVVSFGTVEPAWRLYHPRLPWVQYAQHPHGGFVVRDTRTGEARHVASHDEIVRFAATHSARPGYYGAGDAVHAVTSRLGMSGCTPCAARQAQLNRMFPRLLGRR